MDETCLYADTRGRTGGRDRGQRGARALVARIAQFASIACALAAGAAQASGHMPGLPVPPRSFDSYAACKAHLQDMHRADLASATDRPEEIRPGVTRQILVDTQGVTETGREQASYSAKVGAQIRSRDEARGYIQSNYSYDEKSYACDGRALTGVEGGRGYYSPGYEKI